MWGGAMTLDARNWPRGVIYLTLSSADGAQVTRRVVLD